MIDVDVISAIDLLIERGQWESALETARQQKAILNVLKMKEAIIFQHGPLLDKYVAQYAAELFNRGDKSRVLRVFEKYGASANPANFSMYNTRLIDVGHQRLLLNRRIYFSQYHNHPLVQTTAISPQFEIYF